MDDLLHVPAVPGSGLVVAGVDADVEDTVRVVAADDHGALDGYNLDFREDFGLDQIDFEILVDEAVNAY